MINDHRFIVNFQKYKFLLNQLVKKDIQVKYRNSTLGVFWSFLEPLLSMIVMTIIFGYFFKSQYTKLSSLLFDWKGCIRIIFSRYHWGNEIYH